MSQLPTSNSYGTVGHAGPIENNTMEGNTAEDQQPLLGRKPTQSRFKRIMYTDVRRDWADVVLLVCYLITGILDSASISTWGAFVSMQTGTYLSCYCWWW